MTSFIPTFTQIGVASCATATCTIICSENSKLLGQSTGYEARKRFYAFATAVAPDDSSRKGVTGDVLRFNDGNLVQRHFTESSS